MGRAHFPVTERMIGKLELPWEAGMENLCLFKRSWVREGQWNSQEPSGSLCDYSLKEQEGMTRTPNNEGF